MITEEQCMFIILKKFPGFKKMWLEHLAWWGDEKSGVSNDIAVFSRYTIELLKNPINNHIEIEHIFSLIEVFMTDGSDKLKDAAATCFLENIINATSWKTIDSSLLLIYLVLIQRNFVKHGMNLPILKLKDYGLRKNTWREKSKA